MGESGSWKRWVRVADRAIVGEEGKNGREAVGVIKLG